MTRSFLFLSGLLVRVQANCRSTSHNHRDDTKLSVTDCSAASSLFPHASYACSCLICLLGLLLQHILMAHACCLMPMPPACFIMPKRLGGPAPTVYSLGSCLLPHASCHLPVSSCLKGLLGLFLQYILMAHACCLMPHATCLFHHA